MPNSPSDDTLLGALQAARTCLKDMNRSLVRVEEHAASGDPARIAQIPLLLREAQRAYTDAGGFLISVATRAVVLTGGSVLNAGLAAMQDAIARLTGEKG